VLAAAEAKDWVTWSDSFAAQDHEPTVATLAAELLTSPGAELEVTFASGGQLARGASAAAAAIYSGLPGVRVEGAPVAIDRSAVALERGGWTTAQIRQLLTEWAHRDDASVVVLVDLEAENADEAIHELSCRYEVMHDELDFVSSTDAHALGVASNGSTQLLCFRSSGGSLNDVLARYDGAIRGTASGSEAATMLANLWRDSRSIETSPSHTQRVRKVRRRAAADQLLARVLGR